jgi:hypothetical protein
MLEISTIRKEDIAFHRGKLIQPSFLYFSGWMLIMLCVSMCIIVSNTVEIDSEFQYSNTRAYHWTCSWIISIWCMPS